MTGPLLAVDYGCSHTVAMLTGSDGRTHPVLCDGSPLLPSGVCAAPDGGLLVGRDAELGRAGNPGRFEPHPKRHIDEPDLLLGDRPVAVPDMITATLRRIATEARRAAGGDPADVVLTHPAHWGPTRRAVLRDAAVAAGLARPGLLPEPVAAARHLTGLGHRVPPGRDLVVYDLGGGTFDVTVLRHTGETAGGGFEVLATDGIADLGGVDLDALVVRLIGDIVAGQDPDAWQRLTHPATPGDRRHFRDLWEGARGVKELLSRRSTATVQVPLLERELHITREQFDQAARGVLNLTVDLTAATLRRAGTDRPAAVFLVGGSSLVPLVATLLHRALQVPPTAVADPQTVVAQGAAAPARPAPAPAPAPAAPAASPAAPAAPVARPVPPVPYPTPPARAVPPATGPRQFSRRQPRQPQLIRAGIATVPFVVLLVLSALGTAGRADASVLAVFVAGALVCALVIVVYLIAAFRPARLTVDGHGLRWHTDRRPGFLVWKQVRDARVEQDTLVVWLTLPGGTAPAHLGEGHRRRPDGGWPLLRAEEVGGSGDRIAAAVEAYRPAFGRP